MGRPTTKLFPLKKRLGQHLLVDRKVLGRVVSAARLTKEDYVVEVGPGRGVLTRELCLRAGRVTAVETDPEMIEVLSERLSSFANLRILHGDILKLPLQELLAEDVEEYKVVANLPYYITSPVIRRFLEADKKPQLMVLMVQKEVAESMVAEPGQMSLLSVAVQLYARPRIVAKASPSSFVPPPKVESAIVHLQVMESPVVGIPSPGLFFRVVRAGFSGRRKQIKNSLSAGLGITAQESVELLGRAGIDPRLRAQALGLEEWAKLAAAYAEAGGP